MKYTANLDEANARQVSLAGGKGASLSKMQAAGISVPRGFVLQASAFEDFLKETNLDAEIDALIQAIEPDQMHSIERASAKIQELFDKASMPLGIEKELSAAFHKLGATRVAVRSSATAEDSAKAAWAGQLESFLNVPEDKVLASVKKCWASLFSPRALFYRLEKGLRSKRISVAVVVQEMLDAEAAGISFSVHPITEDSNQLLIEAAWGLGEAVVSGSVTPDSYTVEKRPVSIVEKRSGHHERGLFQSKVEGSEWRAITQKRRQTQVLSDKQIQELAELVVRVEQYFGFPVDVEWALADGHLHIVQSRPITTLAAGGPYTQEYRRIMRRETPLMLCQVWDYGERVKLPGLCKNAFLFDPLFVYHPQEQTSVYYNFSDPSQHPYKLIRFLNDNEKTFHARAVETEKHCARIRSMIKERRPQDFPELYSLLIEVWSMLAISSLLSNEEYRVTPVNEPLVEACVRLREETEGLWHEAIPALLEMVRAYLPRRYQPWAAFMRFEEISEKRLPSLEELRRRSRAYLYHQGALHTGITAAQYANVKNIVIADSHEVSGSYTTIVGQSAFGGSARGPAKIVRSVEEAECVREGDILVAPMTMASMTPAIKRAAAIITDEGGIMSHAAIVSRELNIPCIVGTGNAVETIATGDLLEVNASCGTIHIIERADERA